MDPITLEALGYGAMKDLVGARLKGPLGRLALDRLGPSGDAQEASERRVRAVEALAYLREFRAPSPGDVEDPAETLADLEPEGSILEAIRIARLTTTLRAGAALRDEVAAVRTRFPRLWDLYGAIPNLKPLAADLAGKVSPEGKIEDRATPELASIRGRISSLEGRINRLMRGVLERQAVREAIQDAFVTVRNGRFVIPVRVEMRREVSGIIHGASSTGATVFVEPMEAVEPNNELVTLRDEEESEIRRILLDLSSRLRANLPELRTFARLLGEADLLAAAALFARDFACEPAEEGSSIVLGGARHPVLEAALAARGGRIVPLDVEVPAGGQVLVLSGPNTGGKTAALKTIGLLALMNQSGILLPANHAVLPFFRHISADVGDRQSITENLSTFSARMLRAAEMSAALEVPALVLLDEVGAGTDPEEGGALAVAIVDHFRRRGAGVIATTHYSALKIYAEITEGAANASMEFDEAALAPTFRLLPGIAGRSGGLEMAGRVGLPEAILSEARGRLSDAHLLTDRYLARLQGLVEAREEEERRARAEREAAAEERARAAASLREQEVDLRRRYEEAMAGALGRIEDSAAAIAKEIRDRAAALQAKSEARAAARKAAEDLRPAIRPPAPEHLRPEDLAPKGAGSLFAEIRPGAIVRIAGMGTTGRVEAVDLRRGRAEVLVRGKKMTVTLGDCELVQGAPVQATRTPPPIPEGVTLAASSKEGVGAEIHLIGRTVEEAIGLLDKFLDDALLAGHREVRIIHGHGSGRLRAAIHDYLAAHPLIGTQRPGDDRSANPAVTTATFRE